MRPEARPAHGSALLESTFDSRYLKRRLCLVLTCCTLAWARCRCTIAVGSFSGACPAFEACCMRPTLYHGSGEDQKIEIQNKMQWASLTLAVCKHSCSED